MTLRNDFKKTVDTLQSVIRATKTTTSKKQRIHALTGGRGAIGGRGAGRGVGGGNQYQGKQTYTGGRGGRGGRGSLDKCARLNDHGNPLNGIYWVEDKFYGLGVYAKFLAEQKT